MLFVSSTTGGGSGRSQRELAVRLARRGHEVAFLVDPGHPERLTRWLHGHLADAAVRVQDTPIARVASWLEGRPGRRASGFSIDGLVHHAAPVPQNAAGEVIASFRPEVVVGNSLERLAWRRVHAICHRLGAPTVLYVREVDSLEHLACGEVPDLLLANAKSLQSDLISRGFDCAFVPSLIDLDRTRTTSSRQVALFVNPLPSHGLDLLWQIADRLPEVRFVIQESRLPDATRMAAVRSEAAGRANVDVRPVAPPGPRLYGDARIVLVPHRIDNRPRVVAEAQANGIPVVASDLPGLREATGGGGVLLPPDDVEGWVASIRHLWTDDRAYALLADAALAHSTREELDPDAVATRFEALVRRAISRPVDATVA